MTALAEQAVGTGPAIGRYFNVVSSLPSLLFVSYLYLLIRSGAWNGPVDFGGAFEGDWWKGAVSISLVAFAAALALHPLQFGMIRLLEGYWGTSAAGRDLAVLRARRHRARLMSLVEIIAAADERIDTKNADKESMLAATILRQEAQRERAGYPPELDQVLPTRLGNTLRAHEATAGATYNLDAVKTFPRIALLAPPAQLEYVQDQRLQLELAVRCTILGLAAACATVIFMYWHGAWVLLALAPYLLAYLSYRGATIVAASYGTAVAVVLELNRFRLYEKMRLRIPQNSREERRQNIELMKAFEYDDGVNLQYAQSSPGSESETKLDRES